MTKPSEVRALKKVSSRSQKVGQKKKTMKMKKQQQGGLGLARGAQKTKKSSASAKRGKATAGEASSSKPAGGEKSLDEFLNEWQDESDKSSNDAFEATNVK